MSRSNVDINNRPDPDEELVAIADYVCDYAVTSDEAYDTAFYCLMDSVGCALLALNFPECTKLLGPIVPGTQVPGGVKVLGTDYCLDPVKAAWDNGCLIRWLDYNDTWLAAEWGHPSDNLGGILAVANYVSSRNRSENKALVTVHDVLTAMVKAHEIQGVLALENSFNRVGLDHVVLVKLATTAIVTRMLGGSKEQIVDALSQVWVDGQSLRTYRHAPNTGSRKSWAAGDATSRGVFLALLTLKGEMGYPSAISAEKWGFSDVLFNGNHIICKREYGSYVMENVLFKIRFPAEFHAQTAVEAAIELHPFICQRLDEVDRIEIGTHESAVRIISKTGPLNNPADRDHCLQYMVAIGLLKGNLVAEDYEDDVANDPRIDQLREAMHIVENERFSREYMEADKRSIANSLQVFFADGTATDKILIEYPVGHRRRRSEGIPLLLEKFNRNIQMRFSQQHCEKINKLFENKAQMLLMDINDFMAVFTEGFR